MKYEAAAVAAAAADDDDDDDDDASEKLYIVWMLIQLLPHLWSASHLIESH